MPYKRTGSSASVFVVIMFLGVVLKRVSRASPTSHPRQQQSAFVTSPSNLVRQINRKFGAPVAVSTASITTTTTRTSKRSRHSPLVQAHGSLCSLPTITTTTTNPLLVSSSRCLTRRYLSTVPHDHHDSQNSDDNTIENNSNGDDSFFGPHADFATLGVQSQVLLDRLQHDLHLVRPTAVQSAAFASIRHGVQNVTIGAETGSGKTLAYLLPLMDDILHRKQQQQQSPGEKQLGYDFARAMILVPNKELVQQVVRMAVPLAGGPASLVYGGSALADPSFGGTQRNRRDEKIGIQQDTNNIVRLAIFPGGLEDAIDFQPFRNTLALGGKDPPIDLVIATPATVGPLGLRPKNIEMFADIATLVIDEADMLLDGGYIRELENVLMGFRRADRLETSLVVSKTQHVFVAATLPDYGLRSVDAYLQKKFPTTLRVTLAGMHQARHSGLAEQTLWVAEQSKQDRMKHLVNLLNQPTTAGGLKDDKIMVFLNSVDDVEGASQALTRAGHLALPYHAKMPLAERTATLDRFRRYERKDESNNNNKNKNNDKNKISDDTVPILVCTDLAARGLDVPNVGVVVQLQFAGNVVAHLHRMGRCGRAGQKTGRGIVYYDERTEGPLVQVVREAEAQQERMVLEGADVLQLPDTENEEGGEEEEAAVTAGSVKKAFSRKRGFTKKRKKIRKETEQQTEEQS